MSAGMRRSTGFTRVGVKIGPRAAFPPSLTDPNSVTLRDLVYLDHSSNVVTGPCNKVRFNLIQGGYISIFLWNSATYNHVQTLVENTYSSGTTEVSVSYTVASNHRFGIWCHNVTAAPGLLPTSGTSAWSYNLYQLSYNGGALSTPSDYATKSPGAYVAQDALYVPKFTDNEQFTDYSLAIQGF